MTQSKFTVRAATADDIREPLCIIVPPKIGEDLVAFNNRREAINFGATYFAKELKPGKQYSVSTEAFFDVLLSVEVAEVTKEETDLPQVVISGKWVENLPKNLWIVAQPCIDNMLVVVTETSEIIEYGIIEAVRVTDQSGRQYSVVTYRCYPGHSVQVELAEGITTPRQYNLSS